MYNGLFIWSGVDFVTIQPGSSRSWLMFSCVSQGPCYPLRILPRPLPALPGFRDECLSLSPALALAHLLPLTSSALVYKLCQEIHSSLDNLALNRPAPARAFVLLAFSLGVTLPVSRWIRLWLFLWISTFGYFFLDLLDSNLCLPVLWVSDLSLSSFLLHFIACCCAPLPGLISVSRLVDSFWLLSFAWRLVLKQIY